jgi:hypothetical protein
MKQRRNPASSACAMLGHGLRFRVNPMWIIVPRKGASARINAATKIRINELGGTKVTLLNNRLPTIWSFLTPKNHAREPCCELTPGDTCIPKSRVCKCAILEPAVCEMSCQICVAPLEPATGEDTPFKFRVGGDVEVKKSAILPAAISKARSIPCRAIVNGTRRRCAGSHE